MSSMKEFGFTNPILIDSAGEVIAGHGRLLAAGRLGIDLVPTIVLPHLTEVQKRALRLADNKIGLNAGWDEQLLKAELEEILDVSGLDFEVSAIGFETGEIDVLLASSDTPDPDDEVPAVKDVAISQEGDLWLMGRHRLLCADARIPESYERLLQRESAALVFTDPPYNLPIDGHVSGLGKVKHGEFKLASGEMTSEEFAQFLIASLGPMARASTPGAVHFVCMDWRHLAEMLAAARDVYSAQLNLCVWNKTNAGMGSLYRSKHELVFVFRVGEGAHTNNVELGKFGRHRSNVWDYPGASSFGAGRDQTLAMHPTVKPVAMIADAIKDCSKRNDVVLDGFAGSSSTLIAAERTGRRGFGIELDPAYVDVSLERWVELFKTQPVLEATGESWEAVAARRLRERKSS
jgi:DNA modification methylase